MFEVSVDKKSLAAVKRMLSEYSAEVQREIERLTFQTAKLIETTAKAKAPVGKNLPGRKKRRVGRLKGSIEARQIDRFTWSIGTPVAYAPYMEFGTGNRVTIPDGLEAYASQYRGKGVRVVNIAPRPFLFPAAELHKGKYIQDISNVLRSNAPSK